MILNKICILYILQCNNFWTALKGLSWLWLYGSWIYFYLTISVYHHYRCEFEPSSWRAILDTTLCYQVCQWLATGLWFSPGPPLSSTNKTDCHDKTEILLKVALNTINLYLNCIGVIVISAFTSSAVDRGLDTQTHQIFILY